MWKLLSVFGLVFLLLVVAVSVVVSWSGDQAVPLTELPMFTPLVWIAIGIFTGALKLPLVIVVFAILCSQLSSFDFA